MIYLPRYVALLLLAVSLMTLVGCSGSDAPPQRANAEQRTQPVVKTESVVNDDSTAEARGEPGDAIGGEAELPPVERYVLPNGWGLTPAGEQIALGGMPLNLLPVPGGPYVLITSNGYEEHFLAVFDASQSKLVQKMPVKEGWFGLAVSANGRRVYASGGSQNRILLFDLAEGQLTNAGEIVLDEGTFPAGLKLNRNGSRLYSVANTANALLEIDVDMKKVIASYPVGVRPYNCLLSQDEKQIYVSNWGEDSVTLIDLAEGETVAEIKVSDRPNDLVLTSDEKRLFVSCGNYNLVSVIDTERREVIEQIDVAVTPNSPLGSTPNALAISPDGETLYVANADNNALAVIDIERVGHSQPRGFLPVGWYPTALCFVNEGKQLLVANGKGSVSAPNKLLTNEDKVPGKQSLADKQFEYIATLQPGTLSLIDLPRERELAAYSKRVHQNTPSASKTHGQAEAPFPLGKDCPIRNVFYIIKENRTYDCIFGDMAEGNGDKEYCLFPETVTPNHHAIARQFVLFDNFYHDAEVSADGHHWVTSAYATDYVEKFWPSLYAGRGRSTHRDLHDDPIAFSKGGFLWDLCANADITYRSYGEFARIRGAEPGKVRAATPSLEGHIHPTFYGADGIVQMSDLKRWELWQAEFKEFEAAGEMPRFTVLSLPGDHLLGTRPGAQTPRAMMAENDLVLGHIIEALSKSPFWAQTAVFVVEDDAQNGPDHVDCHRTVALLASPYLRRGFVDHAMYSTSSMLRTMELILGLPPLTQYDAAAPPMWAAFQAEPDLRPYTSLQAEVPLDELNTADAYGADKSKALTLEEADTADDGVYNEILWRALKGRDAALPPRNVAAFVMERVGVEEDEDD